MINKARTVELDSIKTKIFNLINDNDMSNAEVAAVLTTVMQNILIEKHNQIRFERMGIKELSIQTVLKIQQLWTEEYYEAIKKNE